MSAQGRNAQDKAITRSKQPQCLGGSQGKPRPKQTNQTITNKTPYTHKQLNQHNQKSVNLTGLWGVARHCVTFVTSRF